MSSVGFRGMRIKEKGGDLRQYISGSVLYGRVYDRN